jgi:hypothetical protein
MFSLKQIKNITNTTFFENAKELNNKIKNLKSSRLKNLVYDSPLFIIYNLIFFTFINDKIFKPELIELGEPDFLIFYSVISLLNFALVSTFSFVSAGFFKVSFNKYILKNKKIDRFEDAKVYPLKELKKISKKLSEFNNQEYHLFSLLRNYINHDKSNITYLLLTEYFNINSLSEILKNKEEIINISLENLNKEQQLKIIKKIEEYIKKDKNNNKKEDVSDILNNIKHFDKKEIISKNKNFIIKNI